jgi:LPXTG-site transpeptidase (sortase) family protein
MKKVTKGILMPLVGGIILFLGLSGSFLVEPYQQPHQEGANNYLTSISRQSKSQASLPVRLIIPSIRVNANVIEVGLASDGSVDVPRGPYDVAWFNGGPPPGLPGSSVIVGHYGRWQNGANSVFDNLKKLYKGDKIYVENDRGVVTTFVVKEIRIYDRGDSVPDIFHKNEGTHLNLITCSGAWIPGKNTYNQRLVVFSDIDMQ